MYTELFGFHFNRSWADRALDTTLACKRHGNLVQRWCVSRVLGSAYVASACFASAGHELALYSEAVVWRRHRHTSWWRRDEDAVVHLRRARRHAAGVAIALSCGWLAPSVLLMPAMRGVGFHIHLRPEERVRMSSRVLAVIGLVGLIGLAYAVHAYGPQLLSSPEVARMLARIYPTPVPLPTPLPVPTLPPTPAPAAEAISRARLFGAGAIGFLLAAGLLRYRRRRRAVTIRGGHVVNRPLSPGWLMSARRRLGFFRMPPYATNIGRLARWAMSAIGPASKPRVTPPGGPQRGPQVDTPTPTPPGGPTETTGLEPFKDIADFMNTVSIQINSSSSSGKSLEQVVRFKKDHVTWVLRPDQAPFPFKLVTRCAAPAINSGENNTDGERRLSKVECQLLRTKFQYMPSFVRIMDAGIKARGE